MVVFDIEGKVTRLAAEVERAAAELARLTAENGTDPTASCAYVHAVMLPVKLQQALTKLEEEIERQRHLLAERRFSTA